ncbi:uncharacterized protein TNCV_4949611 [Trichonephila clavipes]|nr:uncharacterized protein TNCV_4949611 [Trichonephila clavipes]
MRVSSTNRIQAVALRFAPSVGSCLRRSQTLSSRATAFQFPQITFKAPPKVMLLLFNTVSDLSEAARILRKEKPYATQYEQATQLFLPSTRPPCVDRLYGAACTTPVALMCTIDRYRTDGLSASQLFMVTPILGGGAKRKKRKLLDIETRKPANFSLAAQSKDLVEYGSSSLPPLVSPSGGYLLKQNEKSMELERLPSPEEQAMLLSLEYPSSIVPVDTSGRGFERMSLLRRSLIHADFVIKRKKSKKRSKRRHTFCEGDSRELDKVIRNVAHSSCQTDDFLDVTSVSSVHRTASTLSKRRSRSVQDTSSRRKILDDMDLDSLKQDSAKDSATEDDKEKSPSKNGELSTPPVERFLRAPGRLPDFSCYVGTDGACVNKTLHMAPEEEVLAGEVSFYLLHVIFTSTQDNLLPSPSSILPTIQSESLLQIPIPTTTTTTTSPGNNLNTLVSPLETETRSRTPPATLNSVSTENFPESVPNESNSEHSTAAEAQQIVKLKSRNRRKRSKIPKPNIEIKRVPHRSRNATPTEISTDDEDMITYDVEEEELEQDPFILPEGYLRALTPSRYRNYRE